MVFGKKATPPALLPVAVKAGSLAELAGQYQMPAEYFVPTFPRRSLASKWYRRPVAVELSVSWTR